MKKAFAKCGKNIVVKWMQAIRGILIQIRVGDSDICGLVCKGESDKSVAGRPACIAHRDTAVLAGIRPFFRPSARPFDSTVALSRPGFPTGIIPPASSDTALVDPIQAVLVRAIPSHAAPT